MKNVVKKWEEKCAKKKTAERRGSRWTTDAQGNKYRAIRSPKPPAARWGWYEQEGATINHSMLIKPTAKQAALWH